MLTSEAVDQTALSFELFESLQKAFNDFQVRSEELSRAYTAMRSDFKKVNIQLDSKNKELQQSLAVQDQIRTYLDSILESMDNGVIGVDTAGIITHFNRAAAQITGYEAAEVLGKKYQEVFAAGSENEPALIGTLAAGVATQRDEKVFWRKDGHPVPVTYQTSPLQDRSGARLGAVEIFSDVSRIKALEGEMQHARTMAALGEMSATVAHEIRNPLGAMGMYAALLERDLGPDDPRGLTVKKMIEGLARLNRIVSNLLVYTRPVKAEFRRMALEYCLTEVADFIEIEIERLGKSIRVEKAWDPKRQTLVLADPEKMEQVVMNLCLNAMQAMPEGGVLTVGIEQDPAENSEYRCFRVSDTGKGICEDDRAKIFDPFFTTKENGTGLGLAIVKKFVQFHAGFIDVQSDSGTGASFRIYLPKLKE